MERVNENVKHKNTSIWFDLVRFDSITEHDSVSIEITPLHHWRVRKTDYTDVHSIDEQK